MYAKYAMGERSVRLTQPVRILGFSSTAGSIEGAGPLARWFDNVLTDDLNNAESWEQAESGMFEATVSAALQKANIEKKQLKLLLGGDLLNQIIAANYAARQLGAPFLGLYGACSTMAESILIGSMLVSSGYYANAACASSSHFCSAERQYRFPLEYGNQRAPSAQRTVTGAGCTVLAARTSPGTPLLVTHGTTGRVVDYEITDIGNMGAAMAPAAADTLITHLRDLKREPEYYDAIITGDLGKYGKALMDELCAERGISIGGVHADCGELVFSADQNVNAGGSGCGCCACVVNSLIFKKMLAKDYSRVLFIATGALMNPGIAQQGESIPGIAHAVAIEREGE